jgi:hypothetical protein
MRKENVILKHKILNAIFLAFAILSLSLSAAPDKKPKVSVSRANIRLGFSLRLQRYSFATFSCYIQNSDTRKHKITLRLISDEGFGQGQKNFFFDTVNAPPQTALEYSSPVMIENAERYRLEAFIDGKRQTGQASQSIFVKLLSSRDTQIGTINDSTEKSFGAFVQLPEYKDKYFSMGFSYRTFPGNWVELKDLTAIVVVKMDFSSYSSRQYRALLDYVYQGGILIFAEPASLIGAEKSPLAELLPVHPLRIRKIKDVPGLKTIIPGFKGWDTHCADFLESVPAGDGLDVFKHGDFPVFRWKRYGLGSCRFSAISLCSDNFMGQKAAWINVLKEFFKHQKHYPEEDSFNACLDEMTGFPIPKTLVVKMIILVYFVILAVLLGLGMWKKRSGLAWLVASVAAGLMTLYVLHRAESGNSQRGKLFSTVQIELDGAGSRPVESYCSFFTDSDALIDIYSLTENSVLSAVPPSKASFLPMGMAMMGQRKKKISGLASRITKPLEVQRVDGSPLLKKLKLATKTARQFKGAFSDDGKAFVRSKLPVLNYSSSSMSLTWNVPAGKKINQAFMLFPDGSCPMTRNGSTLALDLSGESMFRADHVMNSLRTSLDLSFRKTCPALALVSEAGDKHYKLPDGTMTQGRKVEIIPVVERCSNNLVTISPDQIVFTYGDTSTRMVMSGNRLKSFMESRGAVTYTFKFTLPPLFSRIKPDKVTLDFSFRNQGGNINIIPRISRNGKKPELAQKRGRGRRKKGNPIAEQTVKSKKIATDTYVFSGEDIAKAVDPLTGSGYLILEAQEKNPRLTAAQKIKANKWAPIKMSIEIKGRIPENMAPFKY